jgi:hypothetical protein
LKSKGRGEGRNNSSNYVLGAGFGDLDDDEIPTPVNLKEDATREDWIRWVRKQYPRKTQHA